MSSYIEELKNYKVNLVVRVCEPTYDSVKLTQNGIKVVDLAFPDGMSPPKEVTYITNYYSSPPVNIQS